MSGRTARVALLDSGVDRSHPHVKECGVCEIGPRLDEAGRLVETSDQLDRLGHGTAAAAAILDLAPGTTLYSIQVFGSSPTCEFEKLLDAFEHALTWKPDIANLSLGTTKRVAETRLLELLKRASQQGTRVVSPAAFGGLPSLPGSLPGVDGVLMDANLERKTPRKSDLPDHPFWFASPFPRELPGLPRGNNLAGVSMACANLTGALARKPTWAN